jgi:hypothetical protein
LVDSGSSRAISKQDAPLGAQEAIYKLWLKQNYWTPKCNPNYHNCQRETCLQSAAECLAFAEKQTEKEEAGISLQSHHDQRPF